MGLLDVLNSIQAGGVSSDPRAQAAPTSQGMSPMAKALLALLAFYAMKNMRRADAPPMPSSAASSPPGRRPWPAVDVDAALRLPRGRTRHGLAMSPRPVRYIVHTRMTQG
jgi:hypothetical protein